MFSEGLNIVSSFLIDFYITWVLFANRGASFPAGHWKQWRFMTFSHRLHFSDPEDVSVFYTLHILSSDHITSSVEIKPRLRIAWLIKASSNMVYYNDTGMKYHYVQD